LRRRDLVSVEEVQAHLWLVRFRVHDV
jgi:hypothetical protein